MVLNNFRHISDRLIKKPVSWFVKHNVSPNTLTFIGFGISVIAGIGYAFPEQFIYCWYLAWVPVVLFFLSGYFDVLDGGVARTGGKTSKFGGFLDSTLDRLADAVIILGLLMGNMFWPTNTIINNLLGFLMLTVSIMISYTRSRAEIEGVFMKGVGFMERAERVFIIMGGYIVESCLATDSLTNFGIYNPGNPYNYWFFPIFTIIFIALCLWTLIARIVHAYKWLSGNCSQKYLEKHKLIEQYDEFKKESGLLEEPKTE